MTEDNKTSDIVIAPADKVKIGYQTAITSISNEGQEIYRSFAALVSANALLITLTGAGVTIFFGLKLVSRGFPVLGILVCLFWYCIKKRQYAYYGFWQDWARHYETKYLSPEVSIKTSGKTYGEGCTLEPNPNLPNLKKFSFFAKSFRIELLMSFIILIFAGLYGILFIASFL